MGNLFRPSVCCSSLKPTNIRKIESSETCRRKSQKITRTSLETLVSLFCYAVGKNKGAEKLWRINWKLQKECKSATYVDSELGTLACPTIIIRTLSGSKQKLVQLPEMKTWLF